MGSGKKVPDVYFHSAVSVYLLCAWTIQTFRELTPILIDSLPVRPVKRRKVLFAPLSIDRILGMTFTLIFMDRSADRVLYDPPSCSGDQWHRRTLCSRTLKKSSSSIDVHGDFSNHTSRSAFSRQLETKSSFMLCYRE